MSSRILVALLAFCLAGAAVAQPAGSPVSVRTWRTASPGYAPTGPYNTSLQKVGPPGIQSQWVVEYTPPTASVIAVELGMIPGQDNKFLFLGRFENVRVSYTEYLAAVLDLKTKTITNVTAPSNTFCGHLSPTSDGKLLVVGGSELTPQFPEGLKDISIYNFDDVPNRYRIIKQATMAVGRWYPTVTLLPSKSILIQGGTQTASEYGPNSRILEVWNPATPTRTPPQAFNIEPTYAARMGKNFFPLQSVLPTGDVLIIQEDMVRIINPNTGVYRTIPTPTGYPSTLRNQWPWSGTLLMGALRFPYNSVEVYIFGGVPRSNQCRCLPEDNSILASRDVYRLTVNWTVSGSSVTYSFPGNWRREDMGIPRQGGVGTLLPNGDIFLAAGSQRGCHGQSEGGIPRHSWPAFWPILYQPDKKANERVTVMDATGIARVYHHAAALTMEGYVLVAGCDTCANGRGFREAIQPSVRAAGWWSPSITGRRDFRTETWRGPYALDAANRPNIRSVSNTRPRFREAVNVTWATTNSSIPMSAVKVTGATLVAPGMSTHGYDGNQRVVFLPVQTVAPGVVRVTMPPNANVMPAQKVMLFLLNSKTHSRGVWLTLR